MKIVLCNGDSLGMPRENVSFQNSWYFKLAKDNTHKNYFFVNNFRRAFNTSELLSKDFLENYDPSIVILQVGIVDCAPRLYKNKSILIKIINRLPLTSKAFWWVSKRVKKRSIDNADISLELFRKNMINYLTRCEETKIKQCIIIKIQTPGSAMTKKNPDIIKAVKLYNNIFDDVSAQFNFVTIISPLDSGNNEDYLEDGYHVNEKGFQKVYNQLKKVFDERN